MSDDYAFQLSQVEEALSKDPENSDLLKLKHDLSELIALMGIQIESSKPSSHSSTTTTDVSKRTRDDHDADSTPISRWVKGQTVLAKYERDQKMYEAVVEAIPTATSSSYVVIFKGYTSREKVATEDVRDFDPTQVAKPLAAVTGGAANKRNKTPQAVAAAFSNGTDRSTKRKKANLEYHEHVKQKETEQLEKQSAWKAFATGAGSGKKKAALKTVAPLKKQSMFASPDDPNAKVGVVGSGKGMTNFQQRGRHVYERTE
ncbi:hypothetical protein CcCBS67573_g04550 [Chytriomyces confervae]|uniref:Tudor domain-containing protein n=1 Tax=Chytriomyces confervae TaxID=246404 RepID=A0A507FF34_9FUNG|nr:hypothetical protein CcCBS67573_g04550 [Chytriomyces confervae]